jgi:hypothetical protein
MKPTPQTPGRSPPIDRPRAPISPTVRLPNYCPRPGLQSANPNASVSKKLAILFQRHYVNAISTTRSIGYSISVARSSKAILILSGRRSRITWASEADSCSGTSIDRLPMKSPSQCTDLSEPEKRSPYPDDPYHSLGISLRADVNLSNSMQ